MGMRRAFVSERSASPRAVRGIELIGVRSVADVFKRLFA
jgi:hypothetical protein